MDKQKIQIVSRFDKTKILFEGEFESFSDCLQEAINQNVDLYGADCSYQTINIKVDSIVFRAVNFSGSRFNSKFDNSKFDNSEFYNSKFYNSEFYNSEFYNSKFYNSEFYNSEFYNSEFDNSKFYNSKFDNSKFDNSEFYNSEFYNSKFNSIGFVNCTGVNYSTLDLTPVRDDYWAVLCAAPKEVAALREALVNGKVDGSTYQGECACLVGTIANIKHENYRDLDLLKPNESRAAEKWFLGIRRGDTPENSEISRITLEWTDIFIAQMQAAFGAAEVSR